MLMGVLYLDKRSPHFDMTDNFLFEMIKVQKYDCLFEMMYGYHFEMRAKPLKHFEMIYDCRFEMTGAKIFVHKIVLVNKIRVQYFGTENSPIFFCTKI